MAQAFNPVGSLSGMAVASFLVLPHLLSDKRDEAGRIIFDTLSETEKANTDKLPVPNVAVAPGRRHGPGSLPD